MAPGLFTMMRKHWKKSSFFLTTACTSLWFTYDYTVTNDVMKTCCRRAALLGDEKLKNFKAQPRHITVILNPVAGKRKSKKLYTKWVEPLLNLAGIKVSLIETESPNQAYDLMKIMANCDGVAIVGGDGTVHEALNGLLHRPDSAKAAQDFPIGIMPTGQYNRIARYIHNNLQYRNQKEFLMQATLRLVDQCTTKYDVLKITPLEEEIETNKNESAIYALRDVRYGKFQDNYVKTSGIMFYQVNIKPYWLRIQRLFSRKHQAPKVESISYTNPCEGCSRCIDKHLLKNNDIQVDIAESKEKSANRKWWAVIAPVSKPDSSSDAEVQQQQRRLELAKRDNPLCDTWIDVGTLKDLTDLRACMMGDKKVRLSLGFNGELTPSEVIETQDVKLKLPKELDDEKRLASTSQVARQSAQQVADSDSGGESSSQELEANKQKEGEKSKKDEKDDGKVRFLVDGKPSLAHSIEISTLEKAVTVYTGGLRIVPLVAPKLTRPPPKRF